MIEIACKPWIAIGIGNLEMENSKRKGRRRSWENDQSWSWSKEMNGLEEREVKARTKTYIVHSWRWRLAYTPRFWIAVQPFHDRNLQFRFHLQTVRPSFNNFKSNSLSLSLYSCISTVHLFPSPTSKTNKKISFPSGCNSKHHLIHLFVPFFPPN